MNKFYDFILKILGPLVRWVGNLHFPFSRKKITGVHYYKWRDSISIGDVILTKTNGEMSNLINPAKIKHAGVYVGDVYGTGVNYVLEAVGRGVVFTDLVTFLTTKDVIITCRPKFDFGKVALGEAAKGYKGLPYDYKFNFDFQSFYCFELVARCFESSSNSVKIYTEEVIKGKFIYSEKSFLDKDLFMKIIDTRE